MTSVLNVDTIADKAGTGPVGLTKQIATKAWTNFNGSGTLAAEDSFNVASVTDNGTGNYTPSATNSMSNTGYAFTLDGREQSGGFGGFIGLNDSDNQTTSGFQIRCRNGSVDDGTAGDRALVVASYLGDLA